MELTPVQRRTLERLIGTGQRPTFAADLVPRLRDRIEEAARAFEPAEPTHGTPNGTIPEAAQNPR